MTKLLDVEASKEISTRIKSKGKPKSCFDNAYRAALVTEGAEYVQGFLVFPGKPDEPVEYSWIEVGDRIIDPTFPHLHKHAEELYYFPAQRLTTKKLKAAIEEAKEDYPEDEALPVYGSTPYEYYGDVMLGGKDYLEAFQLAEAKCEELKANPAF